MPDVSGPESTSALIRAVREGDSEALDQLFARYVPRVSRMVALRLGVAAADLQLRQDLVQEALLGAFRSLGSFEHRSEGSFRNWLAGIVENRVRDHVRRRDALKRGGGQEAQVGIGSSAGAPPLSPGPSPSERAMENELAERMERALLGLGERYRRAFELRRLAGMSYAEMAEEMGLASEASARALFARTLRKIADEVRD